MKRIKEANIIREKYGYNEIVRDFSVNNKLLRSYNFDAIIVISRGGLTVGHFLSQVIDQRNIYSINSRLYNDRKKGTEVVLDLDNLPILDKTLNNIVIVDDIIDSGDTMYEVHKTLQEVYPDKKFTIFTLYQNDNAPIEADIYFHKKEVDWIDFFWEI